MNSDFDSTNDILDSEITLDANELDFILNSNNNSYKERKSCDILLSFVKKEYKKILFLLVCIILFKFFYNLMFVDKEYKLLENELEDYAYDYAWMEMLEIDNKSQINVTLESIKKLYLIRKNSDLNNCSGYVTIKNKNYKYRYKGYISCDNYKTEGYEGVD